MIDPALLTPPYLTADLPGVGGRIKSAPADFRVDEIPAYEPSGAGEHLYLHLEKTDMGGEFFLKQIARRLDVSQRDIGSAGIKDRQAVTTQWISVPAKQAEPNLTRLEGDGIRVLSVSKHGNKLRAGHLYGNRFTIRIRDVNDADPTPIVERLNALGMPNFYGPQRFGRDGETAYMGVRLLAGERLERRPSPFLLKLALSAVQSYLFNVTLTERMRDGFYRTVLDGDVMAKRPAGGMFVSTDLATDQKRFDEREIVHAGPMFGVKTFAAGGIVAEREQAILTRHGLTPASFGGFGQLLQGTRRHDIIYADEFSVVRDAEGLVVTCALPAGTYATVLLSELMKTEVSESEEPRTE